MDKRSRNHLLAGLFIVILLAAVYVGTDHVLRRQEEQKRQEQAAKEEAALVFAVPSEEISGITFPGAEGTITVVQQDGVFVSPDDPDFVMDPGKADKLTGDLASIVAERTIDAGDDLGQYGLGSDAPEIHVELTDGSAKVIRLGSRNDGNHQLYIQTEEGGPVYLTKAALDTDFGGTLAGYALYEEFPAIRPERIRSIEVQKEKGYTLTTPGDDSCTVTGADGNVQSADLGTVGQVEQQLSNINWLSNVDYHCEDLSAYGLEEPAVTIRILSEAGAADDTSAEASDAVILHLGDTDDKGNYYVRLGDSSQVHTIRREYLADLAGNGPEFFWSLAYSFVSIGDLDRLEVTAFGETYVLTRVAEDGKQTDDAVHFYVDGEEVPKDAFTDFYYACASVTAQERLPAVPELSEEPVLTLHYYLTDGTEKLIRYFDTDQNFATVLYEQDTKAASTNRLYVNTMLDNLRTLINKKGDSR